ncbi:MAG: ABC transporter permease [Bacteroidales bacterium]|nr:ABC transporter permease [Bacteroidales bacterium]
MILSLAWKNIWRNKTRSLVVVFAIAVGLFGALFSSAIFIGMVDQRLSDAIRNEVANLQIHHPGFLNNREIADTIPDAQKVLAYLTKDPRVKSVSGRIKIIAMASSASGGAGVKINGICPENERNVTALHMKISDTSGTWFASGKKNTIVIGRKLAERLKLKLRSRVILSFQSATGDIVYGAFRVEGIYKTYNSSFDETNAFVRNDDLAPLAGLQKQQLHEILVSLQNDNTTEQVVASVRNAFPQLETMGWKELMPDLGLMAEYTNAWLYIILIIILLALSFGIINTMMMAVLERTREIGMLKAVGMSGKRIFLMIMSETIFLSLTGTLAGILITLPVVQYFHQHGLNALMFSKGFEDIGFAAMIYPRLNADSYFGLTVLVILAAVLSSIGPSRRALRLRPVEAIRTL